MVLKLCHFPFFDLNNGVVFPICKYSHPFVQLFIIRKIMSKSRIGPGSVNKNVGLTEIYWLVVAVVAHLI